MIKTVAIAGGLLVGCFTQGYADESLDWIRGAQIVQEHGRQALLKVQSLMPLRAQTSVSLNSENRTRLRSGLFFRGTRTLTPQDDPRLIRLAHQRADGEAKISVRRLYIASASVAGLIGLVVGGAAIKKSPGGLSLGGAVAWGVSMAGLGLLFAWMMARDDYRDYYDYHFDRAMRDPVLRLKAQQ